MSVRFPAGSPRVLAAVGTQLPFPRLLAALDGWAASRPGAAVLAQSGKDHAAYAHIRTVPFVGQEEFSRLVVEADVVVAHAGMGTLLACCELGKPLVVLPRRADRGEHRNDHQSDTAAQMRRLSNVTILAGEADLAAALDRALCATASAALAADAPGSALDLIHAVKSFIWGEDAGPHPSEGTRAPASPRALRPAAPSASP